MNFKPRIIKKTVDKIGHKGYSKNIIQFENKCMRCEKIFRGTCSIQDRYEFKRICNQCRHRVHEKTLSEEEALQ